jgi:WD40 repeat protein
MLRTPDGATELHMWDIRPVDLPEVPRVLGDKLEPGAGSVFSPDGRWLATGGADDPTIRLWDLKSPKPQSDPHLLSNATRSFGDQQTDPGRTRSRDRLL